VRTALSRLDGVDDVRVSFMDGTARVTMKPGLQLTENEVAEVLSQASDDHCVYKHANFKSLP
jgi:copper chaperone CopZ